MVLYLVLFGLIIAELIDETMDVGYAPEQPIPFSHKIHAGDNKMECMYCHFNADKSRHATVPAMSVCMGCHKTVATDRPHIKKMHELNEKGESFEWVKIHHLPEHVFFPHQRHVAAGVECQTCHGPIETMDVVKQSKEFTMGFCLDCHRNNDYVNEEQGVGTINYRTHRDRVLKLNDSMKYHDVANPEDAGEMKIHPVTHMNAQTDCSTCHQ